MRPYRYLTIMHTLCNRWKPLEFSPIIIIIPYSSSSSDPIIFRSLVLFLLEAASIPRRSSPIIFSYKLCPLFILFLLFNQHVIIENG